MSLDTSLGKRSVASGQARLLDGLRERDTGIYARFWNVLRIARLPIAWIIGYLALRIVLVRFSIDATTYSARLYTGDVGFVTVVLPFVTFTLANAGLTAVSTFVSYVCSSLIDRRMRRAVWRRILTLPLSFFERNRPKELISRVVSDVESVSQLVVNVVLELIVQVYSLWAVLDTVGTYDPRLTWALAATLPLFVAVHFVFGKLSYSIADRTNTANAEFTRNLSETVTHADVVKANGRESREAARSASRIQDLYRYTVKGSWVSQLSSPAFAIATAIQFTVVALVGRSFLASGAINAQQWVAFFMFSSQIISLASIGYWSSFKGAQGSINRISHIAERHGEDDGTGVPVDDLHGDIVLDKVSFAYGDRRPLDGLSATIPAGKVTAIVGKSGAGKTTLLTLLDRLRTPDSGSVRVANESAGAADAATDIQDYALDSYRNAVVFVPQGNVFFEGTIRQNLLYGANRTVSDDEIERAIDAVGAGGLLRALDGGLDHRLAESGEGLSGGERQLLALVRAVLKRPQILLLDEALSDLDADRRETAWSGLRKLTGGATIVAVSHDDGALGRADHVIVVNDGHAVAEGTPDEVTRNADYRRIAGIEED
ncbi:ABC transporter ATP-binding protein [Bifidobacterium sp. 82T10]|uniref:ABC transporter ATP-binding protein n=1 Tax=Bifidobacterium miconis TaxID=2834435 RepID=A0ABS6WEN0_9BIFI|nr:ABC transporter ATP-binding protein [Bifidobacterium miconis]MBW3091701.1 ABC transporter ATP-binding protein [Bifidobacterium miconis]